METLGMDVGFDLKRTMVQYCGHIRNRAINRIIDVSRGVAWVIARYGQVDVIVLMVGSNDLVCCDRDPRELAIDLITVARLFLVYGIKRVTIMEVIRGMGRMRIDMPRLGYGRVSTPRCGPWKENLTAG